MSGRGRYCIWRWRMTTSGYRSVCFGICGSPMFGVSEVDTLYFATNAKQLGNGLDEQLELFVKEHEHTKLIIVDTLQKVREVGGDTYSYANDYEIISKLKKFADNHGICVLIVHHTRKQPAGDNFEMISGTTGLLGCADGALLMQCTSTDVRKNERTAEPHWISSGAISAWRNRRSETASCKRSGTVGLDARSCGSGNVEDSARSDTGSGGTVGVGGQLGMDGQSERTGGNAQ